MLIGTAWLSSARVVKFYIYLHNERNPRNKFEMNIAFEETCFLEILNNAQKYIIFFILYFVFQS